MCTVSRRSDTAEIYIHFRVLCKKGNRRGKHSLLVIQTRMKAATKKLGNPRDPAGRLPINQQTGKRRLAGRKSRPWSTRMHNYLDSWRMSSKKVSNTVPPFLLSALLAAPPVIYEKKIPANNIEYCAAFSCTRRWRTNVLLESWGGRARAGQRGQNGDRFEKQQSGRK